MFGKDFFKWFQFIIELVRLLSRIFGNGEDSDGFEDAINGVNGKTVKPKNAPSKA